MSDVIEIANTGRARCRRCQQQIDKGLLRFGERIENPFGEGESTQWYHLRCAAEKRPEKLLVALDEHEGEVAELAEIRAIAQASAENPKLASVLRAEPAPTARASCLACREKIEKGSLRIAVEREPSPAGMATTGFLHLKCGPEQLGASGLLDKLKRTSPELDAEQVAELERSLG